MKDANAIRQRAVDLDRLGITYEPCAVCGYPAESKDVRCDGCWEVEHRLAAYLRDGDVAAIKFVQETLAGAIK